MMLAFEELPCFMLNFVQGYNMFLLPGWQHGDYFRVNVYKINTNKTRILYIYIFANRGLQISVSSLNHLKAICSFLPYMA